MSKLQSEAQQKDSFEDYNSAMAFKLFLLEKELGYQITPDMNGIMVIERLKMLDRYWDEQNKEYSKTKSSKGKKGKDKLLKR